MAKYWIANNPNSEVTSAEAQKIKDLAKASVTVDELNSLAADPTQCTITNASTASDTAAVEFAVQFKKASGTAMAEVISFDYYLSTDAAGATVATAAESIADGGAGALLIEYVAEVSGKAITNAAGLAEIDVADSAVALYLNVVMPDGSITTSGVCTWS